QQQLRDQLPRRLTATKPPSRSPLRVQPQSHLHQLRGQSPGGEASCRCVRDAEHRVRAGGQPVAEPLYEAIFLLTCIYFSYTGATFELEVRPGREVWAREGQQVTLSCRISGCLEPSPRLFWSKSGDSVVGGKQTSDESNYHLTFDAVTLKNQNGYYCKAVTDGSRCILCPTDLPRTLRLEPSGPVWAGEQVSLICHVDMVYPIEDLKVEYFKGTELLETISSDRLSLPESSQSINHQLTPAMEDHGKNLSCVAYLKIGKEVESAQGSFILGVHCKYPTPQLIPSHLTTRPSCSCTALWPEGWLPVSAQEATLKLYDVGFSDSGTYRCEASNGPRKETKELQIQIEGQLSITPSVAKQGENVTIACTTSSYPLAQFVLRQSGSSLPKLPSSDGTFTITSVQSANAGQYECEVRNELGSMTGTVEIIIKGVSGLSLALSVCLLALGSVGSGLVTVTLS
uniref:Ig-like domain-containing protein n=1 Tax=Callorhinchus milii TaxID=7868 RepID=A0A4W3IAE7_CALMI